MSEYRQIVIETYENLNEPAAERIRARPVAGQGLPTSLKVQCSTRIREKYPVGTKLLITAKVTSREGGTPFLSTHHSWEHRVLTDAEAMVFINQRVR